MQSAQNQNVKHDGADASDAGKRERSTIEFPYADLDTAVSVAKDVNLIGGRSCIAEQLAGVWRVAPTGGAYRARVSPARTFGLVETERGEIRLTDLGMKVTDPQCEDSARVQAFLHVPLYDAMYQKYKGYALPIAAAVEREMASLGVSKKQTSKARQAFERSAKQAGFFWAGNDRLTLPVAKDSGPNEEAPPPPPRAEDPPDARSGGRDGGFRGGSGGGGGDGYHPFVQGLLATLPEPGTVWAIEGRAAWLEAAATAFRLIYQGEGEIKVEAKPTGKAEGDASLFG